MYKGIETAYQEIIKEALAAKTKVDELEKEKSRLRDAYSSLSFKGVTQFRTIIRDIGWRGYETGATLKSPLTPLSFKSLGKALAHLEDAKDHFSFWGHKARQIEDQLNRAKTVLGPRFKSEAL